MSSTVLIPLLLHSHLTERKRRIYEKLAELGWQEELDFIESGYCMHTLRQLPQVKKAQALTPRGE